jgi:apolipoprotein N-acyltransferase
VLNNISAPIAVWLLERRFWLRVLFCFIGGALGALSLAPISWPVFFFIGFMPAAFYLRHADGLKHAFFYAFFYALGFHIAGLYWISASLFIDIARYIYVLPFSLVALPSWLALLFSLGGLAAHPFRHRPVFHAVFLALMIFITEVARGYLLTGFPWNLFGSIWADTLVMAQSTSLIGVYGLTLLTLLAASLSSLLFEKTTRAGLGLITLSWAVLSGLALWGDIRLSNYTTQYDDHVRLRLVQPGITQEERRSFEERMMSLGRLAQLSRQKSDTPPTHIIWAETAVPDYIALDADLRRALAKLVPQNGVLITGTPGKKVEGEQLSYSNSLAILNHDAAIVGWYDKHHLVPFGEFIPLRGLLKMMPVATDVIGARGDFSPGIGPRTLRTAGFPPFSPLICYEAIFSGHVTDKNDPPSLLLQITNDAWFGNTSGPYQHLAQARLRAIEEGLPLVRAANSGISTVIGPMGQSEAELPLGVTGELDARLPLKLSQPTLFSQTGNTPLFAIMAVLSIVLAAFGVFANCKKQG